MSGPLTRTRGVRAGSFLVLLSVLLLAGAGVIYLAEPVGAGPSVETIIVQKLVLAPAEDTSTFSFTGAITATLGNGGTAQSEVGEPGIYTVSETPVTGWRTLIFCDDNDSTGSGGTATFDVGNNEIVRCTFINISTSLSNPAPIPGWEAGDAAAECAQIGSYDYAFKVDAAAPNGSWTHEGNTITILNSDGSIFDWAATNGIGAVIVKASTGANVWFYDPQAYHDERLYAFERRTVSHVTFCWDSGYPAPAQLTIVKTAWPEDGSPAFWFDAVSPLSPSDFSLTDPGDRERVFGDLAAGTYTVEEALDQMPAGWEWYSVSCWNDDDEWMLEVNEAEVGEHATATVTLEAGDAVTCEFVNRKNSRITVDKVTEPAEDPTLFSFTPGGWNDGVVFQLADLTEKKDTGWTLSPGEGFSVSESVPAGWTLTSAVCTSNLHGNVDEADFDLEAGEQVDCVFTNTYVPENPDPGRIIVRKVTLPDDAPDVDFGFDPSWGPGFELGGGDSHDSGSLSAPGTYSVAEVLTDEQVADGWSLTSATCSDGSSSWAIGLSPRETVTCTFVNTYDPGEEQPPQGSLTIIKVVEGVVNPADSSAEFDFDGSLGDFDLADGESLTGSDLPAGAYTVAEGTLPGSANPPSTTPGSLGYRWHFDRVECTALDWSAVPGQQSVTVNLAQGEAAVCTFYNYQETVAGPELPYTGPDRFMLPLLIGGLWALVMGLSMLVWGRMRRLDLS